MKIKPEHALSAVQYLSEYLAVKEHGKGVVQQAYQKFSAACEKDHKLIDKIMSSGHPYDAMVTWAKTGKVPELVNKQSYSIMPPFVM